MKELEELRAFIASQAFENMDQSLRKTLLDKEKALIIEDIRQYCNSVVAKSVQDFTLYVKHECGEGVTVRIRDNSNRKSREEKNKENNLPRNYGKKWTPEEDDFLRKEYGNNNKSLSEVTTTLERTESSVSGHLLHLGILRFEDNHTYKSLSNIIKQMGEPYGGYKSDPNKLVMLLTIFALIYSKAYQEPQISYDENLRVMFGKCWTKNIPEGCMFDANPDKAFNTLKYEALIKESAELSLTLDRRYFSLMQYKPYYNAMKTLILDLIIKNI